MAITVRNSLSGPAGVQPTAASIAARGTPVTALASPGTLLYDDAHTVHGLTMIRARTGYHRLDSGRITWPLPSGAWAVRIYVWAPLLRPSVDILERRHLLVIGDWAIVLRESTGRNALLRLQNNNDLAVTDLQGTESGTAVPIDQLERVEVTYDGAGTLTGRIYAGDSTSGFRQNQWSQTISATSATFSGYRWFRYSVLGPGSPAPDVTAWQNQLIAWNPNALPTYGADGDYGGETITWTQNFQNAYGISPADGIAGPETRSCMELVLARQSDPGYVPPPLWLGEVAIADTAEWIGPAAPPGGPATGPITITASPHGQKRGAGTAQVQLELGDGLDGAGHRAGAAPAVTLSTTLAAGAAHRAGTAEVDVFAVAPPAPGAKHGQGAAEAGAEAGAAADGVAVLPSTAVALVRAAGTAAGRKRVTGTAEADVFAATSPALGAKHGQGSAAAAALMSGTASQLVVPVPAIGGRATVAGRLGGTAAVVDRLGGHALVTGRLGGTATRR